MSRHLFTRLLVALAIVSFAGACGRQSGGTASTTTTAPKGGVPHISMGQVVKIEDHLVAGKTTLFDFYSDYCPPCVAIGPALEKLHAKGGEVAVVKIDINRPGQKVIDWDSPVAKQFKLESIPHFKIYGPDGKLKSEGDAAYQAVMGMVN